MKLAIFHPAFETVGGAELLAATQARYFRALGHPVKLVTSAFDERRWQDEFQDVPVTARAWHRWTDRLLFRSPMRDLQRRADRAAPSLADSDVVLAHNYPTSAMLGSMDLEAGRVWYCHEVSRGLHVREANPHLTARVDDASAASAGDWGERFAKSLAAHDREVARGGRMAERLAADRAGVAGIGLVCTNSAYTREIVKRVYGRDDPVVVPPMIRFPPIRHRRSGLDRENLGVLVHSRLARPKNVGTVLRGFARFRDRCCSGAVLHVVGQGPQRSRLERLARTIAPNAVHFHGFLAEPELEAIYRACDVFAFLPSDEPFGMVFPEAAARGLLLIGPDHGGPTEILDGGRLGWMCDAFSPEALAETLAEVQALDDAAADRQRTEAHRACRERYGPDVVGPVLLEVLRASHQGGLSGSAPGGSK